VRHQRTGKKLGRDSAHRKALYANLTGSLIEHGRIKTTVTKAKAVKPIAERMITLGRRGDLHARRQAVAFLRSKDVVHKLFAEVAPRFADRPGGYSRIVRLGPRFGDAAEMVYLELLDEAVVPKVRVSPVAKAAVVEESPAAELEPGAGSEPEAAVADVAAELEPEVAAGAPEPADEAGDRDAPEAVVEETPEPAAEADPGEPSGDAQRGAEPGADADAEQQS
jgi:large subunit ribosomal protein L17